MCEFSGKLVAWLDRELPDVEADALEQHLERCPECHERAATYREISRTVASYCEVVYSETADKPAGPVPLRRIVGAALAVTAGLALVLLIPKRPMQPSHPHIARTLVPAQQVAIRPAPAPVRHRIA